MYGSVGEVKVIQGKVHHYFGMVLDYSTTGQVTIDMTHFAKQMIKGFPAEELTSKKVTSPWNDNLFKVDTTSKSLPLGQAKQFHTITEKICSYANRADKTLQQQSHTFPHG